MLKVCGVTFDHTTNYGSCFQAYALQTAIEKISVGEGAPCRYELVPLATFPKSSVPPVQHDSLIARFKRAMLRQLNLFRRKQFTGFEKQNMHYADCHSYEELPFLNDRYDAFVCGSDVVWNLDFTQGNETYFLDFATKYKFSYAASFGVADISKDYTYSAEKAERLFKKNIPSLNGIGVREISGVRTVALLTNKNAKVVCDPVLLLSADEWMKWMKGSFEEEGEEYGKYIFAYSTYISPNFLRFLNQLHEQTGLKVIHVTWSDKEALKHAIMCFPNPIKWLRLLMNAEYVVTNSFHGAAFCTLFHKKFFVAMRDERIQGTRVRLYDYLDELGLRDHIFGYTPEKIPLELSDFYAVDRKLEQFRNSSLAYLQENLEAAYQEKLKRGEKTC